MSTGKIFTLIPKIMSEVGVISKDRKNVQQGYSFRGIDDIYNALQGPLAKYGVFIAPEVVKESREERTTKSGTNMIYAVLTVKFTFFADDGSSFAVTTMGEASNSGDKSSNKAMSAAMKYALLQVFCVPTEGDNDTENHSPEFTTKAPHTNAPQTKTPTIIPNNPPLPDTEVPLCVYCETELRKSSQKPWYYCPNFQDGKEHSRVHESKLSEFMAEQRERLSVFAEAEPGSQG